MEGWRTTHQCDFCCNFGTFEEKEVGDQIVVRAPNGLELKRTLVLLKTRHVGESTVPLCASCIKDMKMLE